MTQQPATPMRGTESGNETGTETGSETGAETGTPQLDLGQDVSYARVLRDQRKVILVAAVLIVADFWILIQLDEWTLAGCVAGGIFLGLLNHLYTEHWLLKLLVSGEQPTRKTLAMATISRLAVLSVVAVGCAVAFWPSGIGLLLGLAVFRLIALVMTTIPLLKELKSQ